MPGLSEDRRLERQRVSIGSHRSFGTKTGECDHPYYAVNLSRSVRSARELALQRMGDVAIVKETCVNLGRKRDRGMRLSQWFEELP